MLLKQGVDEINDENVVASLVGRLWVVGIGPHLPEDCDEEKRNDKLLYRPLGRENTLPR